VTGETWSFTAWAPGEPNNQPGENYLHYYTYGDPNAHTWNDLSNAWDGWDQSGQGMYGYVVEYNTNPVPTPSALVSLLGLGMTVGGIGLFRRRRDTE
jgi:hypothetical protein